MPSIKLATLPKDGLHIVRRPPMLIVMAAQTEETFRVEMMKRFSKISALYRQGCRFFERTP